ncbi:MAG: Lrp/AsnC family transcriptional regulator [Archaeoglobales archaeon]|nr:Lrp/AsnC family transcriptional regulator [Archaeoglobales archaeon]
MNDIKVLMAIQYSLPLTTTPLVDLAENLGKNYYDLEKEIKFYKDNGILRRYGVTLNYKALSNFKQAALVGFRAGDYIRVANLLNSFDEIKIKHNFLRDSFYNLWFTVKGYDVEEIKKFVDEVAKKTGVADYVVLPTKKVYKMDVKYDLYRGISWSEKIIELEEVPSLKDLGIEEEFILQLESLPVERRPFRSFGYKEEEIVSILEELIKKGVCRDFSGILNEKKIGFKENGMFAIKTSKPSKIAEKLLYSYPQITHLVERIPSEKWNYSLYFMVHATSREPIERIKSEVEKLNSVEDVTVIYSKENLRNP